MSVGRFGRSKYPLFISLVSYLAFLGLYYLVYQQIGGVEASAELFAVWLFCVLFYIAHNRMLSGGSFSCKTQFKEGVSHRGRYFLFVNACLGDS